jgi:formylglycine-generating enzyme required for sulfatase activity
MKTQLFRSLATALLVLAAPAAVAQIMVGNVRAAQRAGTKLVDINYDLTGIATPCKVWLEISADGGSTWAVPATSVTGAVGAVVTPGTNLRITWNAGVDWNSQTSAQTRFRVKADDEFALIPAGSFQMGDALDGLADAPVHTVNVSAFYIQKKGVTKGEWDAVRAWGLTHGYTDLAVGAGKAADHPLQTVSWYDVVKWCNARSEQDGLTPCYYTDAAQTVVFKIGTNNIDSTMVKWTANGYRLPTEAEREKASRGGQAGLRFPWGDTISHANANFRNDGGESFQTGTIGYHPIWGTGAQPHTSPAGSFPANAYGIFDMAGNAWEWCWDCYDNGYYAISPSTDPTGPSDSTRVIRGGAWSTPAYTCSAAYRIFVSPGHTGTSLGFRPVRRPPPVGFVAIPAGDFQMGDALDGLADAPVHTVNVSAFYMQQKGVTKAEWEAVRTWGLTHGYTDLAAGAGKASDHPVQTVSWYDVVKWCNARSEQEGLMPCYYTDAGQTAIFKTGTDNIDSTMVKWTANGYRLPTEAEREKAARGGIDGSRYPWGDTIGTTEANYNFEGNPWQTGGQPWTSPVGSYPASSYGLSDIAGNVLEWCWDWYDAGYYETAPGTDPGGPLSGMNRVLRGGDWANGATYCRNAYRNGFNSPSTTNSGVGFRPVRR